MSFGMLLIVTQAPIEKDPRNGELVVAQSNCRSGVFDFQDHFVQTPVCTAKGIIGNNGRLGDMLRLGPIP